MSEMVRTMVAGEDNRRSFDCGRDATFAQDDNFVGGASEEQMRGFFATTPASKLPPQRTSSLGTPVLAGDPGFPLRMTTLSWVVMLSSGVGTV